MFENMRTNHLQVRLLRHVLSAGKMELVLMSLSQLFPLAWFVFMLQLQTTEWERVSSQWLHVEAELLRERAVFGPGPGVLLSQNWVQDSAEGPNRTKLRIRRKALSHSKSV